MGPAQLPQKRQVSFPAPAKPKIVSNHNGLGAAAPERVFFKKISGGEAGQLGVKTQAQALFYPKLREQGFFFFHRA